MRCRSAPSTAATVPADSIQSRKVGFGLPPLSIAEILFP